MRSKKLNTKKSKRWGLLNMRSTLRLKSDLEIEKIRNAGRIAAQALDLVEKHVVPGKTTLELDKICHDFIISKGAIPAPLNYKGFPKSICTSINNVVCHGIPSSAEVLKEGDIINIDVTVILNGWHGDTSRTFIVGQTSPEITNLVQTANDCMIAGINAVKVGDDLSAIGLAIDTLARSRGFTSVEDFVGHGIGEIFHEPEIAIYHYNTGPLNVRFQPGMVFTIEPMINQGSPRLRVLKDGWTAITADGKYSAQFEHTIAIKSDGSVHILTLP